MGDNIFDDVDAILADESIEEEKNFNESELQDIMSEIEDLEKEFEAEAAPEMSLQEKIDAELAMEVGAEEPAAPVVSEAPIMAPKLVEGAPKPAPTFSNSEVAFQARGQMSLNLDFKIGNETAKLWIDPVKGLVVTVSGVELCINEGDGCTVSMENGMKFTIPLSAPEKSHTKKAA